MKEHTSCKQFRKAVLIDVKDRLRIYNKLGSLVGIVGLVLPMVHWLCLPLIVYILNFAILTISASQQLRN